MSGPPSQLDTASFATAPRTLAPTSADLGRRLEAYHMADTLPLMSDVDPAMRFRGEFLVGNGAVTGETVAGTGVGTDAVTSTRTAAVAVMADNEDVVGGATPSIDSGQSLRVGLIRMPSAVAATAAMHDPRIAPPDGTDAFGATTYSRLEVAGSPAAVAFAGHYFVTGDQGTAALRFLADGDFVLVAYTDHDVGPVAKYFAAQTKTFTSTQVDRWTSLRADVDGIRRLTLLHSGRTTASNRGGSPGGWSR
ncbi:DUF7373 family lipoprotein [Tsukamurella soli]